MANDNVRKATDVLLDLESKIDTLLDVIRSQDLKLSILSNKLNALLASQSKQVETNNLPKPTIESINTLPKEVLVSSENNLSLEKSPNGFRRTSRPETFSGDNAFLSKNKQIDAKFPIQIPQNAEIIVPKSNKELSLPKKTNEELVFKEVPLPQQTNNGNAVPVMQRVVDKNGKSIFLADVEIINSITNDKIKTRTNGTGKWMSSLVPGKYSVILRKRDAVSKEKIELKQEISVDGKISPLNLPLLLFK